MKTQAERVINKFGNVDNLAKALSQVNYPKDVSSIYRWKLSKEVNGTAGLIPSHCLPHVIEAARLEGILLTAADLDPREKANGAAK